LPVHIQKDGRTIFTNIDDAASYTPIRTSLWTQLYGRANSVHFENWPESWSATGDQGFTLSRVIYILALLPTALLLLGAAFEIYLVLKSLIKRDPELAAATHFGLTAITAAGFFLFIIIYALEYRDFSVMKAIFLYPAVLTFPLLFLRAGETVSSHLPGQFRWVRTGFGIWIVTLFFLYGADIVTMIGLLFVRRLG
jgi:hypothetical protein